MKVLNLSLLILLLVVFFSSVVLTTKPDLKKKSKHVVKPQQKKKESKSCNKKAQQIIQLYKCRRLVRRLVKLKDKCHRAIETLTKKDKKTEAKALADKCSNGTSRLRGLVARTCSKRYKCKFAIRTLSRSGVNCKKIGIQLEAEKAKKDKADKKLVESLEKQNDACANHRRVLSSKIRRHCSRHVRCFRARIESRKVCNSKDFLKKKDEKLKKNTEDDEKLAKLIRHCKRAVRKARRLCAPKKKQKKPSKSEQKAYEKSKRLVAKSKRLLKTIRKQVWSAKDKTTKAALLRKLHDAQLALDDSERRLRKFDGFTKNCKNAKKRVSKKHRRCLAINKQIFAKKAPSAEQKKILEQRYKSCTLRLSELRAKKRHICGDACKKLTPKLKKIACRKAIKSFETASANAQKFGATLKATKDEKARNNVHIEWKKELRARTSASRRMRCYCKPRKLKCLLAKNHLEKTRAKCRSVEGALHEDKLAKENSGFFASLFGTNTHKALSKEERATDLRLKRECSFELSKRRRQVRNACFSHCKHQKPEVKVYKCKRAQKNHKKIADQCKHLRYSMKTMKNNANGRKLLKQQYHKCSQRLRNNRLKLECYCKFSCKESIARFKRLQTKVETTIEGIVTLEKKKGNEKEIMRENRIARSLARRRTRLGYQIAQKCDTSVFAIPSISDNL